MDLVVVDTDVVSFLFKQDTRGISYEGHLAGKDMIISFMTLAKLWQWASQKNWGDTRRRKLHAHIQKFTILHSDGELCLKWAQMVESGRRKGRPIDTADAWVAATAVLHNVPLVTHNRKHYVGVAALTIISDTPP
jgi:tRNA(fMet)-specific endonuclease VapC